MRRDVSEQIDKIDELLKGQRNIAEHGAEIRVKAELLKKRVLSLTVSLTACD